MANVNETLGMPFVYSFFLFTLKGSAKTMNVSFLQSFVSVIFHLKPRFQMSSPLSSSFVKSGVPCQRHAKWAHIKTKVTQLLKEKTDTVHPTKGVEIK